MEDLEACLKKLKQEPTFFCDNIITTYNRNNLDENLNIFNTTTIYGRNRE